jgi:hypothetical protein
LNILTNFLLGGSLLAIIGYLIAWKKERREQQAAKTAHEKDRPRFDVNVTILKTSYIPDAIVKILSLGSLPLTINYGEVFIEASHCPERVQTEKLSGREIGPVIPIEFKFPLPNKLMRPSGIREPKIELICQFSYGADDTYKKKWVYNHQHGHFEEVSHVVTPM